MAMNVQARLESVGQQIVRKKWIVGIAIVVAALAIFAIHWSKSSAAPGAGPDSAEETAAAESDPGDRAAPTTPVRVDVVRPVVGSMPRTITEPGTVKAFDYANLDAKVSGYLEEQSVDIGDRVKRGQLLAKLFAPEIVQAVEQAKAQLDQAKAQVSLALAGIDRAKADLKAAKAIVVEKETDLKREKAYLAFRQIQYERIQHLYELKAIEEKLVDQNVKERDAAKEAENAARAAIDTAQAEVSAKEAKIKEAEADLANARAKVQVDEAILAKAKVFVDYMEIRSPYTGVITQRSFHVGDFIRAADQGGGTPVLRVARTDKMRVIIKMPESYVPYTDRGDPAHIELDAMPGREFHAKVSRIGDSLDPNDRTMRVEVDLENTKNELRDGMFVHVTVELTRSTKELSIPSTCLVSSGDGTATSVYVVRNGLTKLLPVKVGRDSGILAEIISGLQPDDLVIRHPTADLYSGEKATPVEISNTPSGPATRNQAADNQTAGDQAPSKPAPSKKPGANDSSPPRAAASPAEPSK